MTTCDLNCDMGEGIGNDKVIMPFITSANIACGYHAGDEETMRETVLLAKEAGVAIGAHPSFLDKEHFGRMEIKDITAGEIYKLVLDQIKILQTVAVSCNTEVYHVKPHGALYNMAAREPKFAKAIAQAVCDFDKKLILFGLSGSCLIKEAKALGLRTASEVFADRTYGDDGSLTPRSKSNALIEDETQSIQQVINMVKKGIVTSTSGKSILIDAQTICLHGDGKNAVSFAEAIYKKLKSEGITIARVGLSY